MTARIDEISSAGARVTELPPRARFSLRLRAAGIAPASAALGLELPRRIGQTAAAGGRRALMLWPDEWLIEGPDGDRPALPRDLAGALVDITDREIAFRIEGPRAAELLSIGIARDLRPLAPGRGCRTAFDSVQVVLLREAEDAFTLSVWRSLARHVAELLAIGQRELACGL
ncbi:MAG: sarcosine oxidase subunit gamma family protein [Geminicoccaceae bacterium]|nr:sarcosine oxidase subunit gamma family protein [Geminicoccaceae bacterium]